MEVIAERSTKTVYRDGERTIKLFVENYSKSDILNEALNQARVEETGLNMPKLLEVTKMENRWALISEHIEGKNLQELMNEHHERSNRGGHYGKTDSSASIRSKDDPQCSGYRDTSRLQLYIK